MSRALDHLVEQPPDAAFSALIAAMKPALAGAESEWKRVSLNEAPEFRGFEVIGPNENQLSEILEELLNPQGSHGQGTTFLSLFLKRLGAFAGHAQNHITIHREVLTRFTENQNRRIDVLIDGGSWGVGIENKPWAGEQWNQMHDYAHHLESRHGKNYLLLWLAGREGEITSLTPEKQQKLSAQGQLASWRYHLELLDWVNECREECKAPRVRAFLEEFARFILSQFGNAPDPRTAMEQKHLLPVLEALQNDPDQLHCAAIIAEQFPEIRENFVTALFEDVRAEVLATLGPGWLCNRLRGNNVELNFVETDWAFFEFQHPDWSGLYSIRLESQPKLKHIVLGIRHDHFQQVPHNPEIIQQLVSLGWGKLPGKNCWQASSTLPPPFTNWGTPSGMAAIVRHRADLKDLLTKEFVKLCKHFQKPLAVLAKAASDKRGLPINK